VPPPPGQRTLLLQGPHPHPIELGQPVRLRAGPHRATGDVVDHTDAPPTLTVYVPEQAAQDVLDVGAARVVEAAPR